MWERVQKEDTEFFSDSTLRSYYPEYMIQHTMDNVRSAKERLTPEQYEHRMCGYKNHVKFLHDVVEAGDGASAVQAVRTAADVDEAIDAVVLDYRLPDSNDLTLLATIRRLSPESAVILITAFGTPEVTKGALELGVDDVLHKPFDLHDLASRLLKACRTHRA